MIIFLLDHHNNVLIVFFYTCRSAQLNMDRRMCDQECVKYFQYPHAFTNDLLSTFSN